MDGRAAAATPDRHREKALTPGVFATSSRLDQRPRRGARRRPLGPAQAAARGARRILMPHRRAGALCSSIETLNPSDFVTSTNFTFFTGLLTQVCEGRLKVENYRSQNPGR